jgi:hypothetical protein
MKIYTLSFLMAAAAFLAGNAVAGVEMVSSQSQPQAKAVVVTTTTSSTSEGCGCSTPKPLIHFKDGIPSNGPVTGDPSYADPEGNDGCGCSKYFGFRDYGPAHTATVVTPPPVDTKEMKRPSS